RELLPNLLSHHLAQVSDDPSWHARPQRLRRPRLGLVGEERRQARFPAPVSRSIDEGHHGGLQHPAIDLPARGELLKTPGIIECVTRGLVRTLNLWTLSELLFLDLQGPLGLIGNEPRAVIVLSYPRRHLVSHPPVDILRRLDRSRQHPRRVPSEWR